MATPTTPIPENDQVTVLDASALLAFAQGEPGADIVEAALTAGAMCSAANWSEVAQVVTARTGSFDLVRALITSYDVSIEPVTIADAERAAQLWQPGSGLSLGDRLCLALAQRMDCAVLTADRAWGSDERVRQIR